MVKNRIVQALCGACLSVVLMASVLPSIRVYAAESEPNVITYKEAVKMTTKKLSDLIALEDNIDALKDQRDDIQRQKDATRLSRETYMQIISMENSIKSLDKQIDYVKLNQDMLKISKEMSLRNTLVNIANAEWDIKLLEATITLNEENVRRVGLKKQYGLASDNDLRAVEQTLEQNIANLETQRITLANERQSLNQLLQQPLTANIVVQYERTFTDPPTDIDAYIKNKGKNEPTMKQKQINVDLKKSDKDNNTDPSQKTTLENEYDKAVRERDDAKKSLEAAIRTNYNNLDQLMKREASLQIDLEKAHDNYRTAQANLNAGLATQYDVDSVTLSILSNEIAIEKNYNSVWTLQFGLANPFLLAN